MVVDLIIERIGRCKNPDLAAGLEPFTSLAFGVLVPMFGLAQAGLWGARYGHFGSRFDDEKPGGQAPSK